jgi:hypothetical protein
MAAGASTVERVIRWLIPPASREEVLGDLRERCGTHLFAEGIRVIPFVVASRIRRTTDAVVLSMEALALFTSLVLAAAWLDRPLLDRPWGFARLECPVALVLAMVVLADAYADPKKRPPLRPMLGPVLGIALAFAVPALPWPELIWGGLIGGVLVMTLRFLIPPMNDRPQVARVPAHWQKLELETLNLSAARLLLPFAAVVFLLIALFGRWPGGN